MGIIQRQGLKRSILTYLGVGIGAISTLFIYPLELEAFGLAQFIISTASFFATFAPFGVTALPVRFFPLFQDPQKGHNGFLGMLLVATFLAQLIFWFVAWVFRSALYEGIGWMGFDVPLFGENMLFIMLISVAMVYAAVLESYTSNFGRVAVPSIFTNLLIKLGLPLAIFLLFKGVITHQELKWLLVLVFCSITVALAMYLHYLREWNTKLVPGFLSPSIMKEMTSYALFGILGSFGSVIAFRIDTIMVASMTGTLSSGIYNIAYFISNVIEIPFNAVLAIMGPIIAGSLARAADQEVQDYYRKGSLNLMILGLLFYVLAITCLEDLFRITPRYDELIRGKEVVWYLGLSKIMMMTFGISGVILGYSKFYRLSLFPLLLLAGLNVGMNFLLIPRYQMAGAAMATALSMMVFQVVNIILVGYRIGIHPFSRAMIYVLGFAVLAGLAGYGIPSTAFPLINICIKGTVVCSLFMGPILYFRISPELNDFMWKYFSVGRDILRRRN